MMRKGGLFILPVIIMCSLCMFHVDAQEGEELGQPLPSTESVELELKKIDDKITALEEKKKDLQKQADFVGRDAQRLLFIDFMAYRAQAAKQELLNTQIQEVEQDIARLKARREELQRLVR